MTPPSRYRSIAAAALVACAGLTACESRSPTPPDGLRFGQVGSVTVDVSTPLSQGIGSLDQSVHWRSDGMWSYDEAISYDGVLGDANQRRIGINPEVAAGLYAQWITQVNDIAGAQLFIPELDPQLDPLCSADQSILRLTIEDEARGETVSWKRCGLGPLEEVGAVGAGPDPAAGRVFSAAAQLRAFTLEVEDPDFRSAYRGSAPFATLDRGEVTETEIVTPRVFGDPSEYAAFWDEHDGGIPPEVDFEREIVIVAAIGQRTEAGTEVEVRRVLPVQGGTFVEAVELVPGDFCSPAGLRRTPYHIIVTPRVPEPVRFSEIPIVRIPCG